RAGAPCAGGAGVDRGGRAAARPGPTGAAGGVVMRGMPSGLAGCLLCALLIRCPPAGIAWLLAARRRSAIGEWHAVTAGGGRSLFAAPDVARAGDGWRAEDR